MSIRRSYGIAAVLVGAGAGGAFLASACSTKDTKFEEPRPIVVDAAVDQGVTVEPPPISDGGGCDNQATSISGTAFAPNGTLPLYNVSVYVPAKELPVFTKGASCDRCDAKNLASPIVSTLSDSSGKFKLDHVPPGKNVPLVFQLGKWRRKIIIPEVVACQENKLTDPNITRLPKTQTEGDMPRIAVTTGEYDRLACLLPKIGIDPSEVTPASGNGAIHIYKGTDPAPAPSFALPQADLWNDLNQLLKYDVVMLSCEGNEYQAQKSQAARQAIHDFADRGGRVFASHFHYVWFKNGIDPWPKTADWDGGAGAPQPPYRINTSFPKGQALAEWLVTVGASTAFGQVPSLGEVTANVGLVTAPTQQWVYTANQTHYLSFTTPVGVADDQACGKAVYAAMHVANGAVTTDYPKQCGSQLAAQEQIFAFLLFDLSSCIQKETEAPKPPK